MPTPESIDADIRSASFLFLSELSTRHGEILPREILLEGFEFRGDRISLMGQRGIFRPRQMTGGALSITTTSKNPYGDRFDEAAGSLEYKYFQSDPAHFDNRLLRDAYRNRLPIIYFHGVAPGRYIAAWPSYIVSDDPANLSCMVQVDSLKLVPTLKAHDRVSAEDAYADAIRRGYVTRTVRARIHQEKFRLRVLAAYRTQCAFCRLKHEALLHAAHITPDSDPDGIPSIENGLALCALHHSVFDQFFVTVRPDYVIEVRPDILKEEDGPTLV